MTDVSAQAPRNIDLRSLCPPEWGTSDLVISCYRVFMASTGDLEAANLQRIDVFGWRVFPLLGSIPYNHPHQLVIRPWTGLEILHFDIVGGENKTTPRAAYMILITRCLPEGVEGLSNSQVEVPEDSVVGLLRLLLGRNAAFDKVFSNTIKANGQSLAAGPVAENPGWFGPPDFSVERFSTIATHADSLRDTTKKNRLLLALRWVTRAGEVSGADAFISLWIALETLTMESANIVPVKNALSRICKLSRQTVGERFLLGQLASLRGDIVHGGRMPGIHGNVLAYLGAILADLVDDMLGAPARCRALGMLNGDPGEAALRALLN